MKKFSKFLSVVLALVLCMGMVSPASAARCRHNSIYYKCTGNISCKAAHTHYAYCNDCGKAVPSKNRYAQTHSHTSGTVQDIVGGGTNHTAKCSHCGITYSEPHRYVGGTCTRQGTCACGATGFNYNNHSYKYEHDEAQHWMKCSGCGQTTVKTAHDWNYTREGNTVTAKCVCEAEYTLDHMCQASEEWFSDGTYHWHECTVEGCPIPVMGKTTHTWDEGKITTEPTCTKTGVKTYTCTECGNNGKTESVKATGHKWSDEGTVTVEPTCENSGVMTYPCTACDATKTEWISSLGHVDVWTWDDSQRAFVWSCSRCGATEADIGDEMDVHLPDLDQAIAEGLENGDFASANYRIDVITPNTCISEGEGVFVLTVVGPDGTVETESQSVVLPINPDAHDPAEPVVENLDEETGAYDTVVYCTRCNAEISRTQVGGGTEIDEPAVPLASGPVTRGEFVDYLWRHEDSPEAAAATFTDVAADHEYAQAIGWAQSTGVARGSSSKFAPDDLVTVAQVRLFLARFAEWKGVDMPTLSTLTGADNEAVLNCDEVLAEFFGEEYVTAEDEAA